MPLNIDYWAARRAGYSDDDILTGLQKAGELNIDVDAARDAGYSSSDILKGLRSEVPTTPPPERDFMRGLEVSVKQLPQLGYGLVAGAGAVGESIFGEGGISSGIKQAGLVGMEKAEQKLALLHRDTDEFDYAYDKAKEGSFGELVDFLQYALGYGVGQAGQMLATGGVGSLIGKVGLKGAANALAGGMVRKEAAVLAEHAAGKTAQEITKMATSNVASRLGQTAAVGAAALGMEGGEIFGDLAQTASKEGRQLSGAEIGQAFGATLAAGGLEFVADKFGLDLMLGKSAVSKIAGSRVKNALVGGATAAVGEGGTEYGQTLIEEFGKGNDPFSQEARRLAFNAAAMGAVGGGAMGGAGGAIHGGAIHGGVKPEAPAVPPVQEPDPVAEIRSATTVDDAIARAERVRTEPDFEATAALEKAAGKFIPTPDIFEQYLADAAKIGEMQQAMSVTEQLARAKAQGERDALRSDTLMQAYGEGQIAQTAGQLEGFGTEPSEGRVDLQNEQIDAIRKKNRGALLSEYEAALVNMGLIESRPTAEVRPETSSVRPELGIEAGRERERNITRDQFLGLEAAPAVETQQLVTEQGEPITREPMTREGFINLQPTVPAEADTGRTTPVGRKEFMNLQPNAEGGRNRSRPMTRDQFLAVSTKIDTPVEAREFVRKFSADASTVTVSDEALNAELENRRDAVPMIGQQGFITDKDAASIIKMASALGKQVSFYDTDNTKPTVMGFVEHEQPDVININARQHRVAYQAILGHEFFHTMDEDLRQSFMEAVKGQMSERAFGLLTDHLSRGSLTIDDKWEEVSADLFGNRLLDKNFLKSLESKMDPTMWARLVDYVKDFIDRIVNAIGNIRGYDAEGFVKNLNVVRDNARIALIEHMRRTQPDKMIGGRHLSEITIADLNRIAKGKGEAASQAREALASGGDTSQTKFSKVNIYNDLSPETLESLGRTYGRPKNLVEQFADFRAQWKKELVQGMFDMYAPIKALDEKAYILTRMAQGGDSTLESEMVYGEVYVDKDGYYRSKFGKGDKLAGFANDLAKLQGEHQRFLQWVVAQRAENLKKVGLEHLFSAEDIKLQKKLNEGKLPDGNDRKQVYAEVMLALNRFNEANTKIARDSGLIDQDTYEMYRDTPYVPFYRLQEEGVAGFTLTKGLVNQQAWQRLKGGTEKLNEDLLANVLQNWSHLITASSRNRAAKATIEAAEKTEVAVKIPVALAVNNKNAVRYREDGKDVHYLIKDPMLLDAISAMEYAGIGPWAKPMMKMKHYLTLGVTVSPVFKIRNLIRDTVAATAVTDITPNIASNLKSGWEATGMLSETRANMLASGGIIRFGSLLENNTSQRAQRIIKKVEGEHLIQHENLGQFVKDKVQIAFDAYQELGDRGEQINRAALYKYLTEEKGMGHGEASFWARDLLDFSLQGKWQAIRVLSQVLPFFNARLQGMYKLGRAANANPKQVAYVLTAISLASIVIAAYHMDDDEWNKRDDYDRHNFWWFKIGDTKYRIPKPFEIGAIATAAEMGFEWYANDEMNGKRFADNMATLAGSQLAMNPIPQLVKPMIDIYANRDSFSGQPIESASMQKMRPEDRYRQSTSEVARLLGNMGLPDPLKLITGHYDQLSPVKVDALIRGYFGWLGTTIITGTDQIVKPFVDRPVKAADPDKWFGGFVETLPNGSDRYVNALYEQSREITQAFESYRRARQAGDIVRAAEIMQEEGDLIRKQPLVQAVLDREAQISAQIRMIEANRNLDPEAKRSRIDELRAMRDRIAKMIQK